MTFDIEPYHDIVRLTVTHENLADESRCEAISGRLARGVGEPQVAAGDRHVLPAAPWEMHAELRDAQMARTD